MRNNNIRQTKLCIPEWVDDAMDYLESQHPKQDPFIVVYSKHNAGVNDIIYEVANTYKEYHIYPNVNEWNKAVLSYIESVADANELDCSACGISLMDYVTYDENNVIGIDLSKILRNIKAPMSENLKDELYLSSRELEAVMLMNNGCIISDVCYQDYVFGGDMTAY